MGALKLLLAFAPWIAFWLISGHSIFRIQLGIVVAALLVVVMGVTKLHRGLLLWAGVFFFSFALFSVVLLKNQWVIHHLGLLAGGTLFLFTFVSIIAGAPFTESYAREHTPPELWDSPGFIRSSYTVTGVWGLIFLSNALLNVAKSFRPEFGELVYGGAELALMISGVAFTTIYSKRAQAKRQTVSSAIS